MIEITEVKLRLGEDFQPYYTCKVKLDIEKVIDETALKGDCVYTEIGKELSRQLRAINC